MIPITKDEAMMLRDNNLGRFVKHTYSKNKHYYCVEASKPMQRLKEYRDERVIEKRTRESNE